MVQLWMHIDLPSKVLTSNIDPSIIGGLFVDAVQGQGQAPQLLRSDCGTENGIAASLQAFFHQNENAHIYGKSITNQRIEAFWSKLRPALDGWIDHFKMLRQANIFEPGNTVHMYSMRVAFKKQISKVLHTFMIYWNTHTVRQSAEGPGGIPDSLFYLPNYQCGTTINEESIALAKEYCCFDTTTTGDENLDEFFDRVIEQFQLAQPTDRQSATDLFMQLIDRVEL